ncbi:methylated-DNA--[protein]-cysteine S-methyltransferase [Niveibacterium umoris]|nr:methylated-DNA--[protein]-cysteine S-methyltransferase [Niveibacterium umoris]
MPTCKLGVATSCARISGLVFLPPDTALSAPADAAASQFKAAFDAYLSCDSDLTGIAISIAGTAFQQRVWAAISAIPRGQIRRYGELATQLSSAARAVGQACGANPLPLIIPCHRVLGRNGIGGFANHSDGWLIETKRWLLWREGVLA